MTANHKLLSTILECTTDSVYVKDLEGTYIYLNGAAVKMNFNRPKEEIVGKRDKDLFPPQIAKKFRQADLEVIKSHRACVFEDEVDWNGTITFFITTKTPLINNQGRVIGVIGVSKDVTVRKRLEIEHERLTEIVETTQDAIYSLNETALATSWNGAAEQLFGYSKAEIMDQPVEAFIIPKENQHQAEAIHARIRHGERIPPFLTQRMHRNGKILQVKVSMSPLYSSNGNTEGFSVITREMTRLVLAGL